MNRQALTAATLREIAIPLCLWLAAMFCIPLQLLAGASPNTLAVDIIGITIGLYAFAQFDIGNAGAWLLLMFLFGNTLEPLFIKTILMQSIDLNLDAPFDSYCIELVGIAALSAALVIAGRVNLGRPILTPELGGHHLRVLAWGSLGIGVMGWHLHRAAHQIGGFSSFRDMLFMAVICKSAMLAQSKDGKLADLELAVIMSVGVILGLLDNSKAYMGLPIASYYLTLVCFRQRIPLALPLFSLLVGFLFIEVIAPLIQVLRFLGIQHGGVRTALQIIGQTISYMANGHFSEIAAQAAGLNGAGYYDYFGSKAPWSIIADRYASIQQIDPVVARVLAAGHVDFPLITNALQSAIPNITGITKLPFSPSYYLLLALGFVSNLSGKFPTLPMLGQLDAVYGQIQTFILAFLIFFAYLLTLKKIGWMLKRNVFAIIFFAHFIAVYGSQGEVAQYVNETIRGMPTFLVVFLALSYIAKGTSLYERERKFHTLEARSAISAPKP
jgi:hypothetical protein